MPIRVTIEVEERRARTLHIARVSDNIRRQQGATNTYAVLCTDGKEPGPYFAKDRRDDTPHPEEWDEATVFFEHTYGDGLEECVIKSLRAYQEAEDK